MTTELEQEFFKVFEIEPIMLCDCEFKNLYDYRIEYGQDVCIHTESKAKNPCLKCKLAKQVHPLYPEITDRKLLEMICIYNSFQNDEASLLVPFDINNIKDIALQVITKSVKDKTLNNYYCNDIEKLKTNIQQLFKGGE